MSELVHGDNKPWVTYSCKNRHNLYQYMKKNLSDPLFCAKQTFCFRAFFFLTGTPGSVPNSYKQIERQFEVWQYILLSWSNQCSKPTRTHVGVSLNSQPLFGSCPGSLAHSWKEGPWERAEKRLEVQATLVWPLENLIYNFFMPRKWI